MAMPRALAAAFAPGFWLLSLSWCPAQVVVNEVLKDNFGIDATLFVELSGPPGAEIGGFAIQFPEPFSTRSIALPAGAVMPPDGFFVIGQSSGVPNVDFIDENLLLPSNNGHVILLDASMNRLDGIGWGDDVNGDGGVGFPDVDPDHAIARKFDGVDTDSIDDWFDDPTPSPGAANVEGDIGVVSVVPTSVDFGTFAETNAGAPETRTLTLTNIGGGDLEVTVFALDSGSDAVFSETVSPNLPALLAQNESLVLEIAYENAAEASAVFSGAVNYATDAPFNATGSVPLSAEFAAPVEPTPTPLPARVLINELSYNPNPGFPNFPRDYNGDGSGNSTQDEFIELYNAGGEEAALEGWEIATTNPANGAADSFTFPAGAAIAAGGRVVVFRGGDPAGFAPGAAFTGGPTLANTGETVVLTNGLEVVDAIAYADAEDDGADAIRDAGVLSTGGSIGRATDGSTVFVEFIWQQLPGAGGPTPGAPNSLRENRARLWTGYE